MRSWTSNLKRLPIGVYLWKFCIIEDLKLQYIIEGLFSQEEEEVEFRKKSSIISKLPNFISQSKQMQRIPSKSIGPKWKNKKISKKRCCSKKKRVHEISRGFLFIFGYTSSRCKMYPQRVQSPEKKTPRNSKGFLNSSKLFIVALSYFCDLRCFFLNQYLCLSLLLIESTICNVFLMKTFFFQRRYSTLYWGAYRGFNQKLWFPIQNSSSLFFHLSSEKLIFSGFAPLKPNQFQWNYLNWFKDEKNGQFFWNVYLGNKRNLVTL